MQKQITTKATSHLHNDLQGSTYQHLTRPDRLITVKVNAAKPVLECLIGALILLRQDKPHKVLVSHFPRLLGAERPGNLRKDAAHDACGQAVVAVAQEVLSTYKKVVVAVKLPKLCGMCGCGCGCVWVCGCVGVCGWVGMCVWVGM